MTIRQQVLYLWLAEGDLATQVVAWAFHDGASGQSTALPTSQPPYATGLTALESGWFLLQSPPAVEIENGREYETGHLRNEFVFERRVELNV